MYAVEEDQVGSYYNSPMLWHTVEGIMLYMAKVEKTVT
jgi:hypothetical protein